MKMAESAFQCDDEFLVDLSYAISSVTSLLEPSFMDLHPLFMKNSFYDKVSKMELAAASNYHLSTPQTHIMTEPS